MSKAFLKESDDESNLDGLPEISDLLPPGVKNLMTPEGAQRIRDDLRQLIEVERPRIERALSDDDGGGPYAAAQKQRLQEVDRRIRLLTRRVDTLEVIDPKSQDPDEVLFGATVTVRSDEEGERTYQIVGVDESNPALGRVSWISPIAKTLNYARVGDVVTLQRPKGAVDLEIVNIEYK